MTRTLRRTYLDQLSGGKNALCWTLVTAYTTKTVTPCKNFIQVGVLSDLGALLTFIEQLIYQKPFFAGQYKKSGRTK